MNTPLQPPLILIADDTSSEIEHRVRNCCKVLKGDAGSISADFTKPDVIELPQATIQWSQSSRAADYLALSGKRRTLLLLDVVWSGISDTQGLDIAQELLSNPEFAARSIVILKSTEKAGSAASWAEPLNLALRQLRVSQSVRLRLLAADRTVGGETNRYEQGIISQALLDLQEEALFDAMNSGEWSAAQVGRAIEQIVAADFYGAFAGNKALGRLYSSRVLRRYHQRLSPSYPKGPTNIGISHLMGNKPPTSLQHELTNLTTSKAPESAAIVSALLDYGEIASAERLLFALPLKDNTRDEIKTDFDEQTWKPDKIATANTIKRRCDLSEARKAFDELCTALQACGQEKVGPVAALKDILHPQRIPDILEANRLIAEIQSAVLMDLPAAIAELVESLLNDIERALVEGVMPDFDGISQLRLAQAPEIITLDWDFKEADRLERIKPERKRVRLLNRRLFEHPAGEAARILSVAGAAKLPDAATVVRALKTYIQSPEAISALTDLSISAPEAFAECVAMLSATDADLRLPSDFVAFDRLWREHWKGKSAPAVLKYLQEHGLSEGEFGEKINAWNNSDVGRRTPVIPQKAALLELLISHLAILEYRIRSFCVIIGNAGVTKAWKEDASVNLTELWRRRHWDRVFSRAGVIDPSRGAFEPGIEWIGQLINALLKHPKAKSCYDDFRQFLLNYEVQIGSEGTLEEAKLNYKSPPPAWLRVGNLALPLELILRNLADQDKPRTGPLRAPKGEDEDNSDGTESLPENVDESDPGHQADENDVADLIARCENGDATACRVLIEECGWPAERVDRLRRGSTTG